MKNEFLDWTEPAHLEKRDRAVLKKIQRFHKQGLMDQAMIVAQNTDTIVREEIPPQVWIDMGGSLTKTGMEKLQQSRKKKTSRARD